MILTAHQPVYIPWIGLFHKIALSDLFVSFNQVQYQPKDWNNRNQIKTTHGPIWLTVPVLRKGYLEKTISDIAINNNEPWARKYSTYIEDIYSRRWESLVELNEEMLKRFLEILGIKVPIRSAADWNFNGEKSGLVLNMCQQLGAKNYIFGALGRDYADIEAFKAAQITPHFQKYEHPVYPQLHGDFLPYMSILDLLFNCGDQSKEVLLSGNITKEELLAEVI